MNRHVRNAHAQRGEAEGSFFILIMIGCCLLSAAIALLGWIKETKDSRYQRRAPEVSIVVDGKPEYVMNFRPGLCGSNPCED